MIHEAMPVKHASPVVTTPKENGRDEPGHSTAAVVNEPYENA
jgi:hypothetical protein